jgi:hypothetical protein
MAKRFQILQQTIIELAPLEELQHPFPGVGILEFVEEPDIGVFAGQRIGAQLGNT